MAKHDNLLEEMILKWDKIKGGVSPQFFVVSNNIITDKGAEPCNLKLNGKHLNRYLKYTNRINIWPDAPIGCNSCLSLRRCQG
jgi:hypothetical protein